MQNSTEIIITKPDDWHVHLRQGDLLKQTVADYTFAFGRIVVMPNLQPPITNVASALAYLEDIQRHIAKNSALQPCMTLYLTDTTTVADIQQAANHADIIGCKLYPANATTNSASGVSNIFALYHIFAEMEKQQLPLLIHGEVTNSDVDIFEREKIFIDTILDDIVQNFPHLPIVLEHITSKHAVDYVRSASANIGATITAHHLLGNRNHMLVGGIKPHWYCLPILKKSSDQQALIQAATSGESKFFIGSDSAPHSRQNKESDCGCAGCYTAPHAIELYTMVFDAADKLENLEKFLSINGAKFYKLPVNTQKICIKKIPWQVPDYIECMVDGAKQKFIPFYAQQTVLWKIDTSYENSSYTKV